MGVLGSSGLASGGISLHLEPLPTIRAEWREVCTRLAGANRYLVRVVAACWSWAFSGSGRSAVAGPYMHGRLHVGGRVCR